MIPLLSLPLAAMVFPIEFARPLLDIRERIR